ncbi:TetR/AcrR family transcriptional regulator [Streptomyces sp. NPDC048111]|uniref:TetR/AcrR family transcriptional regulator n=1 Tax=Streptomyces sp. NPDC048111 TaxID=3365500 RepID=UPI0037232578
MPKIVDPVERRREVMEAVFRVVANGGLQQATLQNVAAEAGLAVGSVRHYFASHRDLLLAAAREMADRVEARVLAQREALRPDDDPYAVAEQVAGQFLPLDPARRDETAVWVEFTLAARTDPALRAVAAELHEGLRTVAGHLLRRIGVEDPVAAEQFAALLDGLALNATLHPDRLPPRRITAVLRRQLDQLAALPGAAERGPKRGKKGRPSPNPLAPPA